MAIIAPREREACQSFGDYTTGAKVFLYRQVLQDILERVPRNCMVSLHPKTEAEISCIAMMKASAQAIEGGHRDEWIQLLPEILGLCVRDVLLARSKSEMEHQ